MEHNPISDNRRVSVSNNELGMRNVVSLHCDSERVSHRPHRFAQIPSLQATVLYTSSLTVKKICDNLCLYTFLHQHKGDETQEKGVGGLLLKTVGMGFWNHLIARYIKHGTTGKTQHHGEEGGRG